MIYFKAKSLIIFLAMVGSLFSIGCVSNDPVVIAEKLLAEGKVEIRETHKGDFSLVLPEGRYGKNFKDKTKRGHLSFRSATSDELEYYDKRFVKNYCGSYSFQRTTKERRVALTKVPSVMATVWENHFVINGHRRKVTQIFVPDWKLLIYCIAEGTDQGHGEIVELLLKNIEPK